ncbi:MAG TPA: 2-hydroxyacyl-CoA dehydratase family protein [Myxococcota bacterium]|nr:2-hydroxyacyl-CoA dehydratase family protein [Myxococcota bacterium]HRY93750.1 2-hydroxyacyl-CoA dehydratase family protein [Myxococcota bacterium]HSA22228.1 2-hydroxyacyl-CoA dehydratase family protein [Myxococcota bacterium]
MTAIRPPSAPALAAACREAAERSLARLEARPGRPAGLKPFYAWLRQGAATAEAGGAPLVGQVCNFLPEELALAAGVRPVRLEVGCQAAVEAAGSEVSPDGVCCAVRALLGGLGTGPLGFTRLDLVVVPAACDGKRKLAGLLARRSGMEVVALELPRRKRDPASAERFVEELRALLARLERLGGRRAGRRELAAAIALIQRRAAAFRGLQDLRRAARPPLGAAELFAVAQSAFLADTAGWVAQAEALLAELRAGPPPSGPPPVRLLLTGAPVLWPDFELLLAAEEAGADFVADDLCSGSERLAHPPVVDEPTRDGLLRAAAERVLQPCTCPCFAEHEDRPRRVLELARQSGAQGVVHHTLRGCALFELERAELLAGLQLHGLPSLSLTAEFGLQEGGMLRNRLDAFVEVVRGLAGSSSLVLKAKRIPSSERSEPG